METNNLKMKLHEIERLEFPVWNSMENLPWERELDYIVLLLFSKCVFPLMSVTNECSYHQKCENISLF